MTISSTVSAVSFFGNDTVGPYACAFKVFDQTHVQVYVDGVLQVLTTDYTVSGVGGSSFNVTFTSPVTTAQLVSVARVVPLLQETDYLDNDEFPAETHERALDLLTMMIQQVDAGNTGKAVRFPPSDPSSLSGILPAAASRASKLLGFDTSGEVAAVDGTSLGAFTTGDPHTWTALQTFQGDSLLELVDINPGPSEYGPILKLFADRAVRATNDLICRIDFEGRTSGGARQRWASINSSVHDLAAVDGQMDVAIPIAGTLVNGFRFDSAGAIPRVGAFWTEPTSSGEGPYVTSYRKVVPSANDIIGAMVLVAKNDNDESLNFVKLRGKVVNPADGSEESEAELQVYDGAGNLVTAVSFKKNAMFLAADTVRIWTGTGSPEGAVTAPVGSTYHRTDGGTSTSFYVKESGSGNTGWVAK